MLLTMRSMHRAWSEKQKLIFIGSLLMVQVALFWVSLDHGKISLFCTVPTSGIWAWVAYVHIGFAALFLLGVASIFWVRGRRFYVFLLAIGLVVLQLQSWLVSHGHLTCDGL